MTSKVIIAYVVIWVFSILFVLGFSIVNKNPKNVGPPKKFIRREIPLKEFRNNEFALSIKMLPKTILRSWGFDPDREITWWDDNIEQKRVLVQEVIE